MFLVQKPLLNKSCFFHLLVGDLWPGAPQSAQASLPGMWRSSAMMPRESSCSPLSWRWSWSPPNAVFRASSLLFCKTDTQLQAETQTQKHYWKGEPSRITLCNRLLQAAAAESGYVSEINRFQLFSTRDQKWSRMWFAHVPAFVVERWVAPTLTVPIFLFRESSDTQGWWMAFHFWGSATGFF